MGVGLVAEGRAVGQLRCFIGGQWERLEVDHLIGLESLIPPSYHYVCGVCVTSSYREIVVTWEYMVQ